MPGTKSPKLPAWLVAVVVAVAALVYLNTMWNDFVFDDIPIVRQNLCIRGLSNIPAIFSSGYGEGTQMGSTGLYRPLAIFSFAVNYQAGGLAPWHYHLLNVLLHAANAVLVLFLAFRVTRSSFAAAAAGLLFALHPVNTEAVSPVVGRTDLLGTLFVLCSLLLYAKYASTEKRKLGFLAGSLACLACGLLSKEHAVVTVGLVVLWDLAVRDRDIRGFFRSLPRRLAFPYSLYIGIVGAYIVARYAVVGGVGVGGTVSVLDNPLVVLGEPLRTLTAGKVSLAYLTRLLAPVTLAHDYSYPQIAPASAAQSAAFLFVLAVFIGAIVYSYRKNRHVFYGLAFLAIGFSIVSNLAFNIGTIMAERLLYLPGIGFAIAAGALLEAGRRCVAEKKNLKLATMSASLLLSAVCILLGIRTVIRTFDWRSQKALYAQAVRVVPNSAKVHATFGQILAAQGSYEEAAGHIDTALSLSQPYNESRLRSFCAELHYVMGNVRRELGDYKAALASFTEAVQLRPDFAKAHRNLAFLYIIYLRQEEKGIPHLERTLELDPDQPDADKYREALRKYYDQKRKGGAK